MSLNHSLASYIRGDIEKLHHSTRKALMGRGWLREDGTVTAEGLEASGLPLVEVPFLRLGVDVVLGKHKLVKDTRFPLVWASREHKDRRNWYFVLGMATKEGRDYTFTLMYNPKHVVEITKLPIDTIKKGVIY